MKKTIVLLACVLVLAIAATAAHAQENINFADLPLVASPTPMPTSYAGLNWTNFFYVDPSQYTSGGAGYKNPLTNRDVVFIGGQFCAPASPGCFGIITAPTPWQQFEAVSATMAAGYQPNQVHILAYKSGKLVGSMTVLLGTSAHTINFPQSWGVITELQIETNGVGNLVLLDLSVFTLGG